MTSDHTDEIARITAAMTDLLHEQEVGALATLDETGHPMVSTMHFASAGLRVYVHTFAMFRKYNDMQSDPRVSYTLAHQPPGGYAGRREVRSAQVSGSARRVTDPEEIETALRLSYEQFPWLQDADIYAGFRKAGDRGAQAFFRIDPIRALWADARVRMSYRRLVEFSPRTAAIVAVHDYPAAP